MKTYSQNLKYDSLLHQIQEYKTKNYKILSMKLPSLFSTLTLLLLIALTHSISMIYQKKNVLVKQSEFYQFQVGLQKKNADLIPSYLDIQYDIYNYNGTSCNYFDFFYYVSKSDIDCYHNAIGNQSYLFPCPFLANNYSIIRANAITGRNQSSKTLQINKIQNLDYTYIVDNTIFPFPSGAFPYNDININVRTSIYVTISALYEELALRLIAINVTVLLIFLFIIAVLVWQERSIRKKMEGEKKSTIEQNLTGNDWENNEKFAESSDSQQQQNYTEFLGKTVSPSLLDHKERSIILESS